MSKQERAYQVIRERILGGVYGPGYRLVINQLAREMGLSPIPVREAIRRMEAEGLVLFNRNTGAVVAPMDASACVETLEALAVIEGYATRVSAPHLGAPDLARLRDVNARMRQAMESLDFVGFGRLNREFHSAIYERCPNAYLVDMIRRAWQRMDQVRHSTFGLISGRARSSVEEHDLLVRELEAGAPGEAIEELVREHKMNTVRYFREWAARNLHVPAGPGA